MNCDEWNEIEENRMDPRYREIKCPYCQDWVSVRVDDEKDWINSHVQGYTEFTRIIHQCKCGEKFTISVIRQLHYEVDSFKGHKLD